MTSGVIFALPEPHSVCEVRHDDGSVTKLRRHGNPRGPRLLLSHGNGLAIDLYYPFWSLLADDFDLFVYDVRNHGWNAVGSPAGHNVPNLVLDQEHIVEALDVHHGRASTIGVFHSLTALTALLSPTLGTGRTGELSAWVLFDPPLFKPRMGEAELDEAAERLAARLRQRAGRFGDKADFVELIRFMLLTRAVPGAAELMAQTVLRESPDGGGYELRCPREYEAQIASYLRTYAFLVDLGALPCPTKVIGADPMTAFSYMPTFNLSHIETVDYDFVPKTTHFLQLEQPAECVAEMLRFLEDRSLI